MAKKRPSHTQKLQDEIQNLKNDVKVFQAACKKSDERKWRELISK